MLSIGGFVHTVPVQATVQILSFPAVFLDATRTAGSG